jgi:hypothetical protein
VCAGVEVEVDVDGAAVVVDETDAPFPELEQAATSVVAAISPRILLRIERLFHGERVIAIISRSLAFSGP